MKIELTLLFLILVLLGCNSTPKKNSSNVHPQVVNWPQFRGEGALGIADGANLPLNWDIETNKNIKWRVEIPGLGHSCPIIWEDKLFITTAVSASGKNDLKVGLYGNIDSDDDESIHEFRTICIDKNKGDILWNVLSKKSIPGTKRHTKASHANCTPVTNGEYILSFFGSDGLYCYNMEGELQWSKDFGRMNAGPYTDPEFEWGFASSPIIHEDKVLVQCDFIGECFITSLNLATGEEFWKTGRDEISSWSSPAVIEHNGQKQVVVNGYKHMGGYDFETGEEIWKMSGGGDAPVPTPLFANNLIYIHNSHGRYSPIFAISPAAKGDITLDKDSTSNEYIKWSIKRGAAYMPTNLVYDSIVYNLRMNGQLMAFDALTGEQIYKKSIPEARGITASGVAADGKLYYSTEQGYVFVVKTGKEFEVLAKNNLGDIIIATPAISENSIYFRSQKYLTAVGR